ncbi:MAG TPA: 23S rRNA (adenine(2503)-C(2))-methyltransferase RlmN [Bacilli bacterium]|nr:23S rRNA (adenine(2503)-C(2))-methyltransferase RlmN [Bacilli bacterium]
MKNIFNLSLKELEEYLEQNNEKKYIAKIIYEWLYERFIPSFFDITNISKDLRDKLNKDFKIELLEIKNREITRDTIKYLFKLNDGSLIETVIMGHDYGNSICISSQIGCDMGCAFCASGRLKKVRDLTAGEMVSQIMTAIHNDHIKINSVVVMGIGEPLLNYDNVLKFIRIINDPKGLAIGARHITVSTCGIIPGIKALALEKMQINLALSLHAPNDMLRTKLMPINKAYSINKVLKEIKEYIAKTNRRVTIEYVMINNINDNKKQAILLSKILKGMNVYVNLIPLNEIPNSKYQKSSEDRIKDFYNILKQNKINVTVRREFGGQIAAACGQLRASEVQK